MKRQTRSLCLALLIASAVSASADIRATRIVETADRLTGIASDGTALWTIRLPSPHAHQPLAGTDMIQLSNGYVIDAWGRVLYKTHPDGEAHPPLGGPRGDDCPYWSNLAEVTPPSGDSQSNSHTAPLFDSQGNAWVINTFVNSGNYALQVRRSNGHDGTWGPLETISDSTNYVANACGTIDAADNFTIVFRDIASTYRLLAMRYDPVDGWSGPQQIYSTSAFFQAVRIAADAEGNLVVVFDPSSGATTTLWSLYYDAQTGQWSSAAQVSPAGYDTLLPTLVSSPAGDAIYLAYLVLSGGPTGIYVHRFDSASGTWGPAQMLPGTGSAYYGLASASSHFPATVNAAGELTLFWQSSSPYAIYGSRLTSTSMPPAHELLPPGSDAADMENFAHAASTEFGDAMCVLTRYERSSSAVHFYAFRYRLSSGWDEASNPYTFSYNVTTRSRIAPYRGDYSVATLLAPQDGTVQITARRYERSTWLETVLDVPGSYQSYFQESASDAGEALLVFEAEELFGPNYGIWGTWLRNLPGDLTDDGTVDLNDLAVLLAAYNGGVGGDVDGDGDTDLADLAMMLSHYGATCP